MIIYNDLYITVDDFRPSEQFDGSGNPEINSGTGSLDDQIVNVHEVPQRLGFIRNMRRSFLEAGPHW